MLVKAFGKINLTLEILNRKSDGYHNLRSLIAPLSIHDTIEIKVLKNSTESFVTCDALELHGGLPEDDEMDIAWSLYNKPVLYGDPAPNYAKAYEMIYDLKPGDIFLVIGCSFHTAIAVDLREVARSRGARIIEIQEDAAHNVRKILENIKKE